MMFFFNVHDVIRIHASLLHVLQYKYIRTLGIVLHSQLSKIVNELGPLHRELQNVPHAPSLGRQGWRALR